MFALLSAGVFLFLGLYTFFCEDESAGMFLIVFGLVGILGIPLATLFESREQKKQKPEPTERYTAQSEDGEQPKASHVDDEKKATADAYEFFKKRQEQEALRWQQARQREADARRTAEEQEQRQQEEQRTSEENTRAGSPRKGVKDERYYGAVLGLKGQVKPSDIRLRYRELAAQYHPDKVNHLGPKLREVAETEMKAINEAYEFFRKKYGV